MRAEDVTTIQISERVAAKMWRKHHVLEEEVYEVFENDEFLPSIRRSDRVRGSYVVYGRTMAGRYLLVALLPKQDGVVSVATAREMTRTDRRLYEKR